MRALLEGVGLEPDDDLTMALATASAEHGAADEQVRSLRATIDAGADLDGRITTARTDHALASRLVADLQPSRFLAFLLEEERRALAELGSVHFEELTGNAYRFTDDDRFEVLDMNAAGTERRADSLSGGETFLASPALALALAEMVARGGGRLDAFFLDEGFGCLDPEHLDRAMDGIDRLVANDPRRLVVLVSHVEQMRQPLEDLIVLDKHDLTGDTVVLAAATPAAGVSRGAAVGASSGARSAHAAATRVRPLGRDPSVRPMTTPRDRLNPGARPADNPPTQTRPETLPGAPVVTTKNGTGIAKIASIGLAVLLLTGVAGSLVMGVRTQRRARGYRDPGQGDRRRLPHPRVPPRSTSTPRPRRARTC